MDSEQLLELLARGAPLATTLDALLRVIEQESHDMLCTVLLLDADGLHLNHGAAPSMPRAYLDAIDGSPIGPRAGSCGTAAWRHEAVVVEDIATDPLWEPYRALALPHGLRACWSTPIMSTSNEVLGTFAMYYRTTGRPTSAHRRWVDMATQIAAIAIERERVEQQLQRSELRTQVLVAGSGVGLWDSDLVTGEVYFSPEWKRQLGYEDDELRNAHEEFQSRLHPDDAEAMNSALAGFLAGDRADYSLQFRLRHRDGSWRSIHSSARVLRDASGTPLRVMGCHVDFTDQQRAEEARRNVFERITDAFVAVDVHWNFTYVNARAAEFFGRRAQDLLGRNAWETMPDAVGKPFHHTALEAMRRQEPVHTELHAPNFARWVECRIYPAPDGLSVYFQDITERKLADLEIRELNEELEERVRERTMQLEHANKQLESFSYSVSHDLRAPLRAVSGFAQILDRRHKASLNEEGQHYLGNIVVAGERMGRLIDDLLNYSKLGRRAIVPQWVPLQDVMAHVAAGVAERLQAAHGTLEIAPDLPIVRGDWSLLSQLFGNLLENAVTYHAPGTPPRVTVQWAGGDGYVEVSVADNGIGIPEEHHERIFAAFQRLHSDETYPGTGIGLAVVHRSAELLGGRVHLASTVGGGSVFTVRLPAVTSSDSTRAP